jgi:hypothetical protein
MWVRRAASEVDTRSAEVVRALPAAGVSPVTGVRSTLLASSLQAIRERGLVDAYTAALPQRHHDQVLRTLAPVWLPVDAALAHYKAVDSLRLSEEDVLSIGRGVGDRLHGTFLGTLVRGARHAGFTPWSIASKVDRVWSRVFEGGAIGVVKLGPKEGVLSIRGLPLLSVDYFRVGWRGVLCASVESVAHRCYVRETGRFAEPDGVDFLISWA